MKSDSDSSLRVFNLFDKEEKIVIVEEETVDVKDTTKSPHVPDEVEHQDSPPQENPPHSSEPKPKN
ncbi:hypothetical protein Tco_1130417, partial [Tanacetum coccineum]